MNKKRYKDRSLIREALSEDGIGSAKRLFGGLILLICIGIISYLAIKEGATEHVTHLIDTCLIIAATLLGLSSITNVFSAKISTTGRTKAKNYPAEYYDDELIIETNSKDKKEQEEKDA